MAFGEKLQQLRSRKGLSQEQLADILGVSRQAVSKWERNETLPETEKIIRISEAFGVSIDYLLKDGPEQMPPAFSSAVLPAAAGFRKWLRSWDRYGYLLALVPVLAGLYGLVWSVTGGRSAVLDRRGWDGMLVYYYAVGIYRYVLPTFLAGFSGFVLGFALRRKLCWYHICALPALWGGWGLLLQEGMGLFLRGHQEWFACRFPHAQEWFIRSAMGREWDFTLQCAAAALGGSLLLCLCRKVEGPEP